VTPRRSERARYDRLTAGRHARASAPLARALAAVGVALLLGSGIAAWLLVSTAPSGGAASSLRVPAPTFSREFGADGPAALQQPLGIAVTRSRVYVADAGRGDVIVFSDTGSLVATIGAGRLTTPVYVALNPLDGRLYVSDRQSRTVQVFGVDGAFVRTFDPADPGGRAAIKGWQPLALAFSDDGTFYVSDVGPRQRVLAFGPTGSFVGESGADIPAGSSGGPLSFANGLAPAAGTVVVADSNNSRLIVLDDRLRFRRASSFAGLPRGLATLTDEILAVVDTTGGELRLIDADAATLARAGSKGSAAGQLLLPTSVAADGSGRVFVTDTGNRRISVWRVEGAVRRDLLTDAIRDVRWWGVVAAGLLGAVAMGSAVLAGRNRRQPI